jgi:hypothetical protein
VTSSNDKIKLRDCIDGSTWVQVKQSAPTDAMRGGHFRAEATVVLASGKWMVSDLYWGEAGSCMS